MLDAVVPQINKDPDPTEEGAKPKAAKRPRKAIKDAGAPVAEADGAAAAGAGAAGAEAAGAGAAGANPQAGADAVEAATNP